MSEKPKKMPMTSIDVTAEKREQLKAIFPEIFTEDKIDFDQLKRVLGNWTEPGKERFGLQWPGKAECMKIIQQPSVATLKPCREESVNFDEAENIFIEGDNLEALKLLQKSYFGKIKMIYIDPPYNTGKEFIYPDKYSETLDTYLAYTGQVDDAGKRFSTNTEAQGRFHSRWLNMMYPRLYLARNLLKNNGVVFISIGQDELTNLSSLCNEVFGEENRIAICTRLMKTGGQKGKFFSPNTDYVLIYAKNIESLENFRDELGEELIRKVYTRIQLDGPRKGEAFREMGLYQPSLDIRKNQRYFIECPDGSLVIPPGTTFPNEKLSGQKVEPKDGDGVWRWIFERYSEENQKGNILFKKTQTSPLLTSTGEISQWNIYTKIWLNDRIEEGKLPLDMFDKFENRHSAQELNKLQIAFDFAKPSDLISYLLGICDCNNNDIVLDFFAGSATTAHAVFSYNTKNQSSVRFICIQLPEPCEKESLAYKEGFKTIADIGKERIRRVAKAIKDDSNNQLNLDEVNKRCLGFKVFKLDRSNFKVWEGNIEKISDLAEQLSLHVDHVAKKSTPEDILYELLLKAGFSLTTKVKQVSMAGKQVFSIEDGAMLICLEKEITPTLIDALAEVEPLQIICLDEAFKSNDQLKANAVQTFKARAQAKESEIVFRTV